MHARKMTLPSLVEVLQTLPLILSISRVFPLGEYLHEPKLRIIALPAFVKTSKWRRRVRRHPWKRHFGKPLHVSTRRYRLRHGVVGVIITGPAALALQSGAREHCQKKCPSTIVIQRVQ